MRSERRLSEQSTMRDSVTSGIALMLANDRRVRKCSTAKRKKRGCTGAAAPMSRLGSQEGIFEVLIDSGVKTIAVSPEKFLKCDKLLIEKSSH
jgi:hypothetical protein